MRYLILILALVLFPFVCHAEILWGDPVTIISGNLESGDTDTTGTVKWFDNNGEWWAITTADLAANLTFTWPVTDGAADEFLQTDGSGNLTWAAAGGYWQRNGTVLSPLNANDTVTIPNAVAEDLLLLEYSGADTSGATIELWHNSASPADNDKVGEIIFQGEDDGGGIDDYIRIIGYAEDVTAGTEDGGMAIEVSIDGVMSNIWDCWEDLVVVNDAGKDVDFRVEGENDTNLITTDASKDRIGISEPNPDGLLDINGDDTDVEQGYTVHVRRDLALADTDSPVVYIHQDNAGDDQIALTVTQDGTTGAIDATSVVRGITGRSTSEIGVAGISSSYHGVEGQSTTSHGVYGGGGAGNDDYGIYAADKTKLAAWADLDQQILHPASPASGDGRVWLAAADVNSWEDHKLMHTDEDGNIHDLAVQQKQSFLGSHLAIISEGSGLLWEAAAHAAAVGGIATTSSPTTSFDFTNYELDSHYGRWQWIAEYIDPPGILLQNQVAIGVPFRKFGDGADRNGNCRIIVKARIRVQETDNYDSIKIFLNDVNTADVPQNSDLSADYLPAMADNVWYEASFTTSGSIVASGAGIDIGAWEEYLRAGVIVIGKTWAVADTYETFFDLEVIAVEQWAD